MNMTAEQRARLGGALLAANDVIGVVKELMQPESTAPEMLGLCLLASSSSQFRDDLERLLKEGAETNGH